MALPCSECGIIGPESPTSLPHIATKTLHERCISIASPIEPLPDDSLDGWFRRYQQLAVLGVRSAAVAHKIALHFDRFQRFFRDRYGHDRISACLRRDVAAWQQSLITQRLAPATINNHLASLSACMTWIHAHAPHEIWQADHTPLDVWLIGEGGQPIRPWLTVIEDDYRPGGRPRAFCRTCPSRWSSWTCCC